ncbi:MULTISPECIES: patatin-like phospholipase family protein [unclassified Herbaspirillum]|uniref:patatin-like phospholipase family protein n=1 Tax=unclassified Herbaspirillum TaxID=2624150 RepID=UPI00115058BC|nr:MULTISPECIES: patatin-like phospholipase family protein [unclassified Herbaspirillum]MBB5393856.1 NTE family protein [Herbaspirillum sp. SJZ102]TQK01290.1 NTE family protein [Herbaspirillum sp. SJZ130]TQK05684.1 NTE family protein [Herbaspirillum sp. SJZ106]TWC63197.1 NTE family protein [Herbaspirillum sp. SJZ099]
MRKIPEQTAPAGRRKAVPARPAARSRDQAEPGKPRVALVLQGGGALGAYQAGVYQALHENGLTPDWVVGTSIGAINAAIIAGNPRETRIARLREFWETVAHPDLFDLQHLPDNLRLLSTRLTTLDTFMRGAPGFFRPRPPNPFALGLPVPPEDASFYSTAELRETLARLVDFEYLNRKAGIRMTVSAVKVTCGTLVKFDSATRPIGPEHIMASGALPPGFAPVRIDGELYWDGGLYSNTPLEAVLNDEPRMNTLCMMVDLWHADGPEPTTLEEVQTREKDVTFASRSQRHIDAYLKQYQLRRAAHDLYQRLPPVMLTAADRKMMAELGADTTIHIVRLPYAGRDWNMASKDVNFGRGSLLWRWDQGYQDGLRGIEVSAGCQFESSEAGIVVHELPTGETRVKVSERSS